MRRAAKIDANQAQVVTALRAAGAVVHSLAAVGNGIPDLLIAFRGQTILMEVKNGKLSQSAQRLRPLQADFHNAWTGGPLSIVDGPEAALRAIGCIK